jgi:hypothetical protein
VNINWKWLVIGIVAGAVLAPVIRKTPVIGTIYSKIPSA